MKTKTRSVLAFAVIAAAFFAAGFTASEVSLLTSRQSRNEYYAMLFSQGGYEYAAGYFAGAADEDAYLLTQQ